MATFAEATAVKAIDSRTYSTFFHDAWAIGSVPHGGIVTSTVLAATKLHFDTTLSSYKQPHSITLNLEFLRRTSTGPATITIQNTKLGRRTSTVHVVLTQNSGKDKSATPTTCVVGYITQSNLTTESGLSLPTHWALSPPPTSVSSAVALRRDGDPNWTLQKHRPFSTFRKVGQHVNTYLLREAPAEKAIVDEWVCFSREDQRFTQESLGFVSDLFPQIVEHRYSAADVAAGLRGDEALSGTIQLQDADSQKPLAENLKNEWARFWYPTVLLNLDIKKALPAEGVEFLFVRVRAKQIKNGRFDLEVTILDESGDLVALSTHVALVLGSERNMKRNSGKDVSKL